MNSAPALDKISTHPELLGMTLAQMRDFFESLDEKPFRAIQLTKWIHQHGVTDFKQMSDLSKNLREKLSSMAQINLPEVSVDKESSDGTRKWLIKLADGNQIETVYIPSKTRGTLCISSQVGCSLNCRFCYTAQQGYNRNLSASEIIAQLWLARHALTISRQGRHKITNVVLMGMGEPLLNFESVLSAIKIMLDDNAYGLSRWRVTLSTSGVVPMIYKLAENIDVALAVSLHAADNMLRDQLVPINKKYPLDKLMQACKDYVQFHHKMKVTFEYVMLAGINDSPMQARQLIRLLEGVPAKINLIPFNPFSGTNYQCSSPKVISEFQQKLMRAGINTIVRRTRGQDIEAACGQLAGKITDRTRRSAKARS